MIASAAGVEGKEDDVSSGGEDSTVSNTGQENLSKSDSGVHRGGERGDCVEAPVKFSKYVIHVLCINFTIFFYYLTESSVNFR